MKFNDDKDAITVPKYQNCFVYFLLKGGEVVYVGQTKNGIERPFSHKDKDFDEIKIIYCEETDVDAVEDGFIKKYTPDYNKQRNYFTQWSLLKVRNCIRKATGISNFTIPKLKKILRELGIIAERDIYTGGSYIPSDEYPKIISYIRRTKNGKV